MKNNRIFYIIAGGGWGDSVLTTPVFKHLKAVYPNCKVFVYWIDKRHRMIYENNPYIDRLRKWSFFSMPIDSIIYFFNRKNQGKKYLINNYGIFAPSKVYEIKASAIIGQMMGIHLTDTNPQIFLRNKEEKEALRLMQSFKNPIIINITSQTSSNQNWPKANWEKLILEMPDYTFIQLGIESEEIISGAVDLRGKTSIRISIAMLKYACSFVGVVSFLAHASATVGIPGVVLFGPSTPIIWGHPNNINLFKNLPCSPCIDLLRHAKCPYGCVCMSSITVEDVKDALKTQLQKRFSS
jgi:ADP-heptose:LPS heptosyltransferase